MALSYFSCCFLPDFVNRPLDGGSFGFSTFLSFSTIRRFSSMGVDPGSHK